MGDVVKKRRWGRRVVGVLVVLIVPLVVGYFVATSEPFLKSVILPRAGKSLNARITVTDASIKPFSQIIVRGLKVQTSGTEPLATVEEVRVRHSLTDIIRGNIMVHELTTVRPVIHIIQNPDGTSNLDPILKSQKGEKPKKPSRKKDSKPPQLDIGQVKIENGTLRRTQLSSAGPSQTSEVSDLNFTLANLKNEESGSIDLSAKLTGALAGALQSKLNFALTRDLKPATLSGDASLTGFSVTHNNRRSPVVNLDLSYAGSRDVLEKFQVTGTQNQKPLITVSLAQPMSIAFGKTATARPDSTLNAKITGFSFKDWAALLGDDVPEGNLNANLEVQSRESGKLLALKGDAELSGLMLNDPDKRKLMKPLEAKFRVDSSFREKVIELTQLAVALTPTQLAKNEAMLKGRIDLSRTNATGGKLELFSDALDLTGYYELFAGREGERPREPKSGPRKPSPAPSSQSAPQKKELPFKDLVVDTRIGDVYLRELHLSNVVTGIKLDGARIDLKPISLALNGAPVNGAVGLDLAVSGYAYDLVLKMDAVPLAPIANSFAREYSGRAKGDLNANIQIKGVGTTGASLKNTLQGQIIASCTNGQIQLASKNMRRLFDKISGVLRVPELRTATLTAFDSDVAIGAGKIQVKKLDLISEIFTAHTEGAIPIADILTNSPIPKLPVTFALRRSYAEKASLVSTNAPTNTPYVLLPPFLYLTGTLGKPDTEHNEGVILAIAARSQAGRIGGEAGKVVQDALDIYLGGGKGTNAPSTNKPANPLDLLLKKKPK